MKKLKRTSHHSSWILALIIVCWIAYATYFLNQKPVRFTDQANGFSFVHPKNLTVETFRTPLDAAVYYTLSNGVEIHIASPRAYQTLGEAISDEMSQDEHVNKYQAFHDFDGKSVTRINFEDKYIKGRGHTYFLPVEGGNVFKISDYYRAGIDDAAFGLSDILPTLRLESIRLE